jgi:hypothetical protein
MLDGSIITSLLKLYNLFGQTGTINFPGMKILKKNSKENNPCSIEI